MSDTTPLVVRPTLFLPPTTMVPTVSTPVPVTKVNPLVPPITVPPTNEIISDKRKEELRAQVAALEAKVKELEKSKGSSVPKKTPSVPPVESAAATVMGPRQVLTPVPSGLVPVGTYNFIPAKPRGGGGRKKRPKASAQVFERIELAPLPQQVAHIGRMIKILTEHDPQIRAAYDPTPTGGGKTYMAPLIKQGIEAKLGPLKLCVICPAQVIGVWEKMAARTGVVIHFIIAYSSLIGRSGSNPKHGFLSRNDAATLEEGDDETGRLKFSATKDWFDLIDDGIILFCDEAYHIRNKKAQKTKAACELTSTLIRRGGRSRVVFMTATVNTLPAEIPQLCRNLDLIQNRRMYVTHNDGRDFERLGLGELIDNIAKINPIGVAKVVNAHEGDFNPKNVDFISSLLFHGPLFDKIRSMAPPPDTGHNPDISNYYGNMTEADLTLLTAAIEGLTVAAGYDEATGTVRFGPQDAASKGSIGGYIHRIQAAKTRMYARWARERLESNPQAKVSMMADYKTDVIYEWLDLLSDFNPLVLTGDEDRRDRDGYIELFLRDPTRRLIIGTTTTCGTGIDLDDQTEGGQAPRLALIMANWSIGNLIQAIGRFSRAKTTSAAEIRVGYGKGTREHRILKALGKKSGQVRASYSVEFRDKIILPDQFPDVLEPDNIDLDD